MLKGRRKISLSCDLALSLTLRDVNENAKSTKDSTSILGNGYFIVCPRAFFPGDKNNYNYRKYIHIMEEIIMELAFTNRERILILLNSKAKNTDKTFVDDDEHFVTKIKADLRSCDNIYFMDKDLNLSQMLDIYNKGKLVIGTRLHSLLFAVLAAVPFVGIAYNNIKFSIFNRLGLGNYVFSVNSIQKNVIINAIDDILRDRGIIMDKIIGARKKAQVLISSDRALNMLIERLRITNEKPI